MTLKETIKKRIAELREEERIILENIDKAVNGIVFPGSEEDRYSHLLYKRMIDTVFVFYSPIKEKIENEIEILERIQRTAGNQQIDNEPLYTAEQIRMAFWKSFHKSGENFFNYLGGDDENQLSTVAYWEDFYGYIKEMAK